MHVESAVSERSGIKGHLFIVTVLLMLLIGPIFGPLPAFLGERFGLQTAVISLLITFVVGFSIILTVIFRLMLFSAHGLPRQTGSPCASAD